MIETLIQLLISGAVLGSIYGLIGVGFSVVHTATGAINFAQGEFAVLGAFLAISLTGADLPHFFAVIISPIVLTLFVVLLFRIFLTRVADDALYLVVATIALSLMLKTLLLYFWGREPIGLSSPFQGKTLNIAGLMLGYDQLLIIAGALIAYIFLLFFFSKHPAGKAMKAVVEEKEIAMASGLNPALYQGVAFAFGSLLGAFAGCLVAPVSMLSYNSGGLLGLKGFASAIFAGLDRPERAVFGGIILGVIESLVVLFVPSGFKDVVALIVLLIVLTLKPEGFLSGGRKRLA
ncbi:MAG: branched-chain amino acid ABC transporter permease [Actinobacteria bacterium]|nr:branched-chain amino acid ABC transporter permease [Actinomycetota bacterium]